MREDVDRAQSIQVEAVVLFGVLILLVATWRAVVVPQETKGRVKYSHRVEPVTEDSTIGPVFPTAGGCESRL